ncbi:endonuclease [Methylomonas koyamae]|uniref:Endonuclease n=1 Tax=Methylomonas koyamae TaxID=702114 RepID=A0A177N2G7_9GAMM|nr:Z1 domain-containing protein [Methylomonas koyamae]OAI12075.1 endonuclease [Methylomonas koyamae]
MAEPDENFQNIVKIVQVLLVADKDKSTITPALISEKIDLVILMNPQWAEDLDREGVIDELIRRNSQWIGQDTSLVSDVGHEDWLNSSRKQNWRYWQRYREWLEKKLSWKAIEALDKSSDSVLALLEDPTRTGRWDRRGLVVGHVQSGKTGNYTGLICKAADAGYKIIIVLAGLHNNLRSQTQIRLEEGFLGYETLTDRDIKSLLGVGEIDSDKEIHPNCATNRSNSGDFSKRVARNLAVSPEERPWLFVVKKNKTVLRELLKWIQNHAADTNLAASEGLAESHDDLPKVKKIVTKLPLLIIDDEADHASVDTQEQVFDAEGNPDDEHLPTTINRLIRRILHSFSKSAYVGYTATPFANIFIHERGETRDEGPDLFPSSFIINLAAPSNYIGPSKVFGLMNQEGLRSGLPLVRLVDDYATEDGRNGWMPQQHKNGHRPLHNGTENLPPSIIKAIDSFVLTCAVRQLDGQANEHCSMLVHVTRFNSVQKEVCRQVEEHIRHMRQRLHRNIEHEMILQRLKALWEEDFKPTSQAIRSIQPDQTSKGNVTWDDIQAALFDTISDIEIRMINGTAKDALDYDEHKGTGLKVIAIGGDKLARGLTLEGLCVSYFLRASRMYDTLMQMGRWFGYRPGYLDLCRLYTTAELSEWFGHIADAAEELREEFDLMVASGATPREYGLKVQSHPVLMVTSRLKMRAARDLWLSFSGQLLETVVFHTQVSIIQSNLKTTIDLLESLGKPTEANPERQTSKGTQKWSGFLWRDGTAIQVVDFLDGYITHPSSYKVKSNLIAEFIRSMNEVGELTNWTIALIGGGKLSYHDLNNEIRIDTIKRSNNGSYDAPYSIGRLLSPRDEFIDSDSKSWDAALEITKKAWKPDSGRLRDDKLREPPDVPNGPAIRELRGKGADGIKPSRDRGLLFLYLLEPSEKGAKLIEGTPPVVAFAVSFPGSTAGKQVLYKVNSVEWHQWEREYGPAE